MANSRSGDALLDRVMRVFEALEAAPRQSPGALAQRAGLPRSTAYRLIEDMSARGLLSRAPDGSVELGRRLWEISQRTALSRTLRQTALPFMEDVNSVVRQTTQLAVLDEDTVLIVERLSRHGSVVNPAEVASRMPVHVTSMGHALLAFSPAHTAERILRRQTAPIAAERPDLRRELAEVRRLGYACLDGLINPETTGVSAPVVDERGYAVAVLTVVVPRGWDSLPQAVTAVRTASRAVSRELRRTR